MVKRAPSPRQSRKRQTHRNWLDPLLAAIVLVCMLVVGVASTLLWRASPTQPTEPSSTVQLPPQPATGLSVSQAAPGQGEGGETSLGAAESGPATSPSEAAQGGELQQLNGTGESVQDGLAWPACQKAVFYWTLSPAQNGEASLRLQLRRAGQSTGTVLVNEFATGLTQPLTGAALQPLHGGEYSLSAEGVYSPWSVRVVCQDGEEPLSRAPDLAGSVSAVTPDFELSACNQLALLWSVEPDSGGRASIIVKMYIVGRDWPDVRVNEAATGLDEPLSDLALFSVEASEYFLVVDKVSGPWTIRWECRG